MAASPSSVTVTSLLLLLLLLRQGGRKSALYDGVVGDVLTAAAAATGPTHALANSRNHLYLYHRHSG